jgi:hypothetical protein
MRLAGRRTLMGKVAMSKPMMTCREEACPLPVKPTRIAPVATGSEGHQGMKAATATRLIIPWSSALNLRHHE